MTWKSSCLGVAGSSAPGRRGRVEDASPEACEKAKPSKAPGKTQKPSEACEKAKLSKARTRSLQRHVTRPNLQRPVTRPRKLKRSCRNSTKMWIICLPVAWAKPKGTQGR